MFNKRLIVPVTYETILSNCRHLHTEFRNGAPWPCGSSERDSSLSPRRAEELSDELEGKWSVLGSALLEVFSLRSPSPLGGPPVLDLHRVVTCKR